MEHLQFLTLLLRMAVGDDAQIQPRHFFQTGPDIRKQAPIGGICVDGLPRQIQGIGRGQVSANTLEQGPHAPDTSLLQG